jgi:DNA topoisomerase-1
MKIAQGLYESGHITYMRTDSVTISKEGIKSIEEVIKNKYGKENYKYRVYQSKNASAQEAHEAIRPTHPEKDSDDSIGSSLYKLIWQRSIASLMSPAEYQVFQVTINCLNDPNIIFKGSIERLKNPGYLKVYGQDVEEEITLDSSKKSVKLTGIYMTEKISSPPSRYNEPSLVKDLEKLSIARPSTYSSIIIKIKDRNYIQETDFDGIPYDQKILKLSNDNEIVEEIKEIIIGKEKKRLAPTPLGEKITKILIEMCPKFMDIHFTAETEKVLDEVAEGKKTKLNVLNEYWSILKGYLEKLSDLVITKADNILLGQYNNKNIYIITNQYGIAIKCEGKTKKDNIFVNITDTNIDLPQAILLLENKSKPKESGELIGEEGIYKYYKDKSKYGDVIKRISDDKIEYRNIDKYFKEINMELVKLLFSYPKEINKKISLNYNLIKDSYYLRQEKIFVSVPKNMLESSKEELLALFEANKDKKKVIKK